MLLVKGVHGNLQCGEIPGAYPERLTVYAHGTISRTELPRCGVWQKAHEFMLAVHRLTEPFPDREKFGLSHQMRRAAVSIPANIAEGSGKRSQAEKARFLNISEGSLEECRYYLILAHDLGYGQTDSLTSMAGRDQSFTERLCAGDSGFWPDLWLSKIPRQDSEWRSS